MKLPLAPLDDVTAHALSAPVLRAGRQFEIGTDYTPVRPATRSVLGDRRHNDASFPEPAL